MSIGFQVFVVVQPKEKERFPVSRDCHCLLSSSIFRLFTKCPETKLMFDFPIDFDPECEEIKSSKRFSQHSRHLILMLDRAVNLLGPDIAILHMILADLGTKHARIGVKEEYYPYMGEALIRTLKNILGDKLTPEAIDAWRVVYDVLCGEMVKASNYDKAVLISWNKLKEIEDYPTKAGTQLFQRYVSNQV